VDDRAAWAQLLAGAAAEPSSRPERIAALCVKMLGVSGAGICLATTAGNRGVVCATDDIAARIEDLQFTLGEGPCMDAVQTGTPVMVADLREADDLVVERWPAFMEGASGAGVRAMFALPLQIGAISVGALDLYRDRPGDLSADELAAALLAADAAAVALLHLEAGSSGPFTDDAATHSAYRAEVHQATGMVQVQLGIPAEEAFLMIRARAFASGRPLADVATDVVTRRLRFSLEDQ
jgi:hypothetical protein